VDLCLYAKNAASTQTNMKALARNPIMATMSETETFDVVIAGGGMVGTTLARLLSDLDSKGNPLRVALLDRAAFDKQRLPFVSQPESFDPRVSALTLASKALFQQLGVWQHIEAMRQCPYTDMDVWDAEGTGSIHFSAAEVQQASLGSIVENSIVTAALYEDLDAKANLRAITPFNVSAIDRNDAGEYLLHADDGKVLATRLLVAADGANSKIRELAGFHTREWDYGHTAIVTTVRTEHPHQHTAWQRFIDTGPLAFLPLDSGADQNRCSIVWSVVTARAEQLMALPDDAFMVELGNAFEHRLGKIESMEKRFQVPLRQRHATEYFQDGIVLVGDAAHTIHPLAGQGVNLGLLDAMALSEALQAGLKTGRKVNDKRILERYQRQRKPHNLRMMWVMEGFKHLFAEQAPPAVWMRNFGLSVVNDVAPAKNLIIRHAIGMA